MTTARRLPLPDLPPPPRDDDAAARDAALKERLRAASEPLGFGTRQGQAPAPEVRGPTRSIQLVVPDYLFEELGLAGVRRRVTKRYIILEALRQAGYTVRPEDLDEDGRRRR